MYSSVTRVCCRISVQALLFPMHPPVLCVVIVAAGHIPGPAPCRRLRRPQIRFVLLHRDALNPEGQQYKCGWFTTSWGSQVWETAASPFRHRRGSRAPPPLLPHRKFTCAWRTPYPTPLHRGLHVLRSPLLLVCLPCHVPELCIWRPGVRSEE